MGPLRDNLRPRAQNARPESGELGSMDGSGRDFRPCRTGPCCATVVGGAGRVPSRPREEREMTSTDMIVVGADGSPTAATAIE